MKCEGEQFSVSLLLLFNAYMMSLVILLKMRSGVITSLTSWPLEKWKKQTTKGLVWQQRWVCPLWATVATCWRNQVNSIIEGLVTAWNKSLVNIWELRWHHRKKITPLLWEKNKQTQKPLQWLWFEYESFLKWREIECDPNEQRNLNRSL